MIHIYYRVSTDKQDFSMQDIAIRNMLKSKCIDYNLCKVYQDLGISGTTTERPEYQRLLLKVENWDTVVVVYELSRLWRDMADQTAAVKQLLKREISFLSVADGEVSKNTGTLIANIKGSINEFEAERLKIRITAGIRAKKERVAAGKDTWKKRGADKTPRHTEGYFRRYQKPEGMRND
jgi:DNA invertase Pin-like site-specific DNA recombinase